MSDFEGQRRNDSGRGRSGRNQRRDGRGGGRPQGRGNRVRSQNKFNDKRGPRDQERTPSHNPADLRVANRSDRERSPDIDPDVTGKELDRPALRELSALDDNNRSWVSKHLVMASKYLEEDPELAYAHALAASRRGGRLGLVREAVGMTAYASGKFSDALREFRTYRRITGDNSHIAEIVDSERALGRHEKALELAADTDLKKIPITSRVELAMVVSGIYQDLNEPEEALKALEIPQLNPRKGFSYSPRLFSAYAEALTEVGRDAEAKKWENLSRRAARALGQDLEPDPEIFDLGDDDDADARPPRAKDVVETPKEPENISSSEDGRQPTHEESSADEANDEAETDAAQSDTDANRE